MSTIDPTKFFTKVSRTCDSLRELHGLVVLVLFSPERFGSLAAKINEEERQGYTLLFQTEIDHIAAEAITYLGKFKVLHDKLLTRDGGRLRGELEDLCTRGEPFFERARRISQKRERLEIKLGCVRGMEKKSLKDDLMIKVDHVIKLCEDLRNKVPRVDVGLLEKSSAWWEWLSSWRGEKNKVSE